MVKWFSTTENMLTSEGIGKDEDSRASSNNSTNGETQSKRNRVNELLDESLYLMFNGEKHRKHVDEKVMYINIRRKGSACVKACKRKWWKSRQSKHRERMGEQQAGKQSEKTTNLEGFEDGQGTCHDGGGGNLA